MYHANVNISLMAKFVTRIKGGITTNVGVSANIQENRMRAKKIIFATLLHYENGKYAGSNLGNSVITCD